MPRRAPSAWTFLAALLAAGAAAPASAAGTLFLNRCLGNCVYLGGAFNSACNNTSAVLTGNHQLGAYSGTDGDWQALLACVRSVLDPFDVAVTDIDPGCANQWEMPVAGTASQAGFGDGVLGVAPAVCTAVPNNIAFTFGNEPEHAFIPALCWTVVHEFAHLIGVEHEILARDPMSYVNDCFVKRFTPVDSLCGTDPGNPESCFCSGGLQSSFGLLRQRLGAAAGLLLTDDFEPLGGNDSTGPTCHWDQVSGEEVPPPFAPKNALASRCATDHSVLAKTR